MAIATSNHITFGGYDYDLVDVLEHDRHICKICYFLYRDPYMGEYLFFKSCLDNAYEAAAIMPAQFSCPICRDEEIRTFRTTFSVPSSSSS